MSIEEEILDILEEKDTEKLKRYILTMLRPEKIDLISEEDFKKYFVITESTRTLAKILTAICKLPENMKMIITGEKGVGKTSSLRYIFHILKKHINVSLIEIPEQINDNFDKNCFFVVDNFEINIGNLINSIAKKLREKTYCVEIRPFWVLKGLQDNIIDESWQIVVLLPPRENEIREMVKKRFGEPTTIYRNPLLTLLSQVKSSKELGIHLHDTVRKQKGTKQKILWTLTSNEEGLFVKEIAEKIGRSPATISRHLKELEEERLIRAERIGKRVFYRLTSIGVRVFVEETIVDELLRKYGSRIYAI